MFTILRLIDAVAVLLVSLTLVTLIGRHIHHDLFRVMFDVAGGWISGGFAASAFFNGV